MLSTIQASKDQINISHYINILKNEPSMRSIDDIAILKYYLTHSNLTDKFKNDGIDPLNYDKMIIISSTYEIMHMLIKGKCFMTFIQMRSLLM